MGKQKPDVAFNVQASLARIEQFRLSGDGEAMLEEISRPWPGMDDDIRLAVQELMTELLRNGKVPLFMKDLKFDDEDQTVTVELPDWFHAASQVFAQRYPDADEADLRFQKSMAALQHRLMLDPSLPDAGYEELIAVLHDWLPDWPANLSMRTH